MFHPKLIRDDYVVGDLLTVEPSVLLDEPGMDRKSWAATINEVKVQYTELIGVERVLCTCDDLSIDYEELEMGVGTSQTLEVVNPETGCLYSWKISSGGGSLSAVTGNSVEYTAPISSGNVTITLSSRGEVCDTLNLTISACSGISIGYTTQGMAVDEEQVLSVEGAIEGVTYDWEITSGGGSLSALEGVAVTYTAPASNPECANNATITLSVDGNVCDTLEIAVNAYGAVAAYYARSTCTVIRSSGQCYCYCGNDWTPAGTDDRYLNYGCDGVFIEKSDTYDCSNFPCYHWTCDAEEAGVPCTPSEDCCASYVDHRHPVEIEQGCCPAALL